MKDERFLPMLQEVYDNSLTLPQPLEIQLAPYSGTWNRFDVMRSEEMAKSLYFTARLRGIEHMHGIMGMLHVNQVAYFLGGYNTGTNPNK